MDLQQWPQYGSFPLQNSLQPPPHLDLSLGAGLPTENIGETDANRPFSNAYVYGDSLAERPFGWMSLEQAFGMAPSNNEVDEIPSKEPVIAIQLYVALVRDLTINTPGLISEVDLEAEAHSVTKKSGIYEISVRSIMTLTDHANLPFEIAHALRCNETQFATARSLPLVLYPVQISADFRLLASMVEIVISPPSNFLLQSVPSTDLPFFVPMRDLEKPKFVLILLPGLTDFASTANSALTAFQSEPQPSNPNSSHADRSLDVTYSSISSLRRSSPPAPLESQPNLIFLASPNHGEATGTVSEMDIPANLSTDDASSFVPQSSASEVDEVGPPPTLLDISSLECHIPIRATDIKDACCNIGIRVPKGTPKSERRPFSDILQDWYRAWLLTLFLGYDETKGSTHVQTYTWKHGNVETFEQILGHVNWKRSDYEYKTSLYTWAINATSTKVWDTSLSIPVGRGESTASVLDFSDQKTIAAAKRTWNRLHFLFQSTSFLYAGNPRSARPNSREFDLTYLHQNDVKNHKEEIKHFLVDRPEFSA
ncbi:hypothetical protein F5880DRAFT_1509711 [Lentinula raphanica]|nr:hypothetical protein F5880DRAFT_1509711 [Lentinula raphanica]